jgi:hypothetical protein
MPPDEQLPLYGEGAVAGGPGERPPEGARVWELDESLADDDTRLRLLTMVLGRGDSVLWVRVGALPAFALHTARGSIPESFLKKAA